MKSAIASLALFILVAAGAFAADAPTTNPTDAQKSFATLKTLAGEWEGPATVAGSPEMSGAKMHLTIRVTSRGKPGPEIYGSPIPGARHGLNGEKA